MATKPEVKGLHFHSDAALAIRCPFCGSAAGELCGVGLYSNPDAYAIYGVESGYSIYAHMSRDLEAGQESRRAHG